MFIRFSVASLFRIGQTIINSIVYYQRQHLIPNYVLFSTMSDSHEKMLVRIAYGKRVEYSSFGEFNCYHCFLATAFEIFYSGFFPWLS